MRSHTFRDGTTIPAGTFLGCPTTAVHADEGNYQDAYQFEPFRFVQEDTEKGKQPVQFASTNPSYIPFGHGKSACPGRFFASVEMYVHWCQRLSPV
jgi:cytochrome P450